MSYFITLLYSEPSPWRRSSSSSVCFEDNVEYDLLWIFNTLWTEANPSPHFSAVFTLQNVTFLLFDFHNFSIFCILGKFAGHNLWRFPITHYYRVSINFTFSYSEITTSSCQNLRKSQDTIGQKSRKFERLIKIKNKFTFSRNFFPKWAVFNTFDWTCCHSLKTRVALLSLPCN